MGYAGKLAVSFVCGLVMCAFVAQSPAADISVLFGDVDGFGVGCPIEDGLNYLDYGAAFGDYREQDDPVESDWWSRHPLITATYAYQACDAQSANLRIFGASMDWAGPYSGGVTLQVVYNGQNIYNSPDWTGTGTGRTRLVDIPVPTNLLTGQDDVQIIYTPGTADCWIFDFAELTIECAPVPEPATVSMLASGAVLAACLLRRRS